jgi:outer membrane protein OmpA-like peptidoglycan-associated protein
MRGHVLALALAVLLPASAYADNDEEPDPPDDSSEDKPKPKKKQSDDGETKPVETKPEAKPETKPDDTTSDDGGAKTKSEAGVTTRMATADHDILPPRVTFMGEALGATPLDEGNRALFGVGGGVAAGAEIYVSPLLGVSAGATFLFVGKDVGMSSTSWIAGRIGPRLHFGSKVFGENTRHDAWVDAHAAFGSSGGIKRPGFDAGAAVQWEVSPALRIGPMVRYQFGADPRDANAQLFTIGIAIGYGGRTRNAIHVVGDRDGDGVNDTADACPDEASGDRPDPAKQGCPLPPEKPDTDKDGIADEDDWCPRIPQGDNPHPKQRGCPAPQLARVVANKIEILQQIFFETDLATIKAESTPVLESVAAILSKNPKIKIRVEGHTDSQGDDAYNLDLSKRRARSVAQWLIENGQIDASRLTTEGYGKTRPLVAGDDAKNRRVEFVIVDGQ